jgi:hypothetical protein
LDGSLRLCCQASFQRCAEEMLEPTIAATSVNDAPLSNSLAAIIRRASSASALPDGLMPEF